MKSKQWKKIGILMLFLAVAAFALSGCSSGSDGATGATGATGTTGATGAAGPAGPVAGTNASAMTVAEVGTLLGSSTATIDSVTIASAPVVKFTVKDAHGNGITGLNIRNTSTPPGLRHIRFIIAKLVPGTDGSPSKWVNYIVTTPGNPAATPPVLPVAAAPTADSQGTLVDNGGGSYTYTFWRDLAKIKDTAGVTDVTYDPTLTHRLVLTLTHNDAPEKFPLTVNKVFDFTIDPTTKAAIPVTATSTRRDITTTEKCNSCHSDISKMFGHGYLYNDGGHFDTRPDVRNCIMCHSDQQRIGVTAAQIVTSVNGSFPALTATQLLSANRRTQQPRIGDGEVMLDMPIMIHKLHMGERLTKKWSYFDGVNFNNKVYTQDITNCRKCHSGDTAAELAAAPQGNNWKDKPSRLACGSCHDGINWTTGGGTTVSGATTGHVGGRATSDALCYVCHDAVSIDTLYHVTINATPNNPSVPAGATNFTYDISSVTVGTGADLNKPIVKFRIMAVTPPATTATPITFVKSTGTGGVNPLAGFTGAPSFLVAYAKTQDGITAPADFNNLGNGVLGAQPVSVSIAKLCDTSVTATATVGSQGSMTGPDASGYYTATLTGPTTTIMESTYIYQIPDKSVKATAATSTTPGTVVVDTNSTTYNAAKAPAVGSIALPAMPANPALFPAGANLRTVALQGYFTQVTPALARHATMVMKAVGETSATVRGEARRLVVDSAKCAQCHEYFEGHGGNRNYNMDGCTVCHNPNLSSSGTIINDPTAPEATQNMKDMIHSIHAGMANGTTRPGRTNAYKHTRSKSGINSYYDWSDVIYPTMTFRCETCHKPGTYAAVPAGALPTVDVTPATTSVFAARTTLPNATDIVISPYSAACVACHDDSAAKAHMTANGGFYGARSGFTAGTEQCAICHGAGRSADAAEVHTSLIPGN